MIDYIRENLSYYPLYYNLLFKNKKEITPERVDFGSDKSRWVTVCQRNTNIPRRSKMSAKAIMPQ